MSQILVKAGKKFGNSKNGQGAIRVGSISDFSEMNKQACPFIRKVRANKKCFLSVNSLLRDWLLNNKDNM